MIRFPPDTILKRSIQMEGEYAKIFVGVAQAPLTNKKEKLIYLEYVLEKPQINILKIIYNPAAVS